MSLQVRRGVIEKMAKENKTMPESQEQFLADDRNVHRYFVARKGILPKAIDMLYESILWRDSVNLSAGE